MKMLKTWRNLLGLALFTLLAIVSLNAEVFRLSNGNELIGTLSDANQDGVVINLEVGGFSPRTHWIEFDQPTLLMLAANPGLDPYVFPYIEIPEEEIATPADIPVNDPPTRYEPPDPSKGFLSAMMSPVGLVILLVLFAGNLYAGFEVAKYRGKPVAMVCGASAVLPVIAPILFLFIPDEMEGEIDEQGGGYVAAEGQSSEAAVPSGKKGSLSLGSRPEEEGASSGSLEGRIWKRGDVPFNRRFFESTFTPFFRVVPAPEVKDLILAIRCGRNELVGKRISRISGSDLHLVLLNGAEKTVTFSAVDEVQVRHKNERS